MSYSQYPSANPQRQADNAGTNTPVPPQKNNDSKKLLSILLVVATVALIGTWAYIIYDKNKTTEKEIQYVDRIIKDSMSQADLQLRFNSLSGKADSITVNNQQLQGALAEKKNAIDKLKSEIAATLRNKNATKAELAEAQKKIYELESKIEGLYAEVEKLKAENTQLTASNEQLNTDKTKLTEEKGQLQTDLDKTKDEKAKVENLASTLHASNITVTAVNTKGKETSTAKKVDQIKVGFDIDENRVAPSGQKSLMVCIYHPDGSLSVSAGTFTDNQGREKHYTNKVDINYEQGKKLPVSFNWKPGNKFETGDYKIEIYHNGFKIGEGTKSLKKATFLGL